MKRLELKTSAGVSQVYIDESLKNLLSYLPDQKTVIITDKNVRQLYGHLFPVPDVIEIGMGEGVKTLKTVEEIYQKFLDLELDRSSLVVGIGGGVVCDITGFCASTYMRGLHFGFVPSTLVAQVDASIGGKNGVNFKGYKNIVGIIRQPQFILVDFTLLKTLPDRDFLCGVSEIIKSALIKNKNLFETLEEEYQELLARNKDVLEKVVTDTITIKVKVVERDVEESGERRVLNFGHTFGHAIEKTAGLPHGEAVSIGMAIATDISVIRGMLTKDESRQIKTLLQKVNLPVKIPCDPDSLLDAVKRDKKRHQKDIYFVLLSGIGRAETEEISYQELKDYTHDLCKHR